MFGPVVTLQNVAVISSMQKTAIRWGHGRRGLDALTVQLLYLDDVASCAAAGDAAKSNAEINPSFFIGTSLSLGASQ